MHLLVKKLNEDIFTHATKALPTVKTFPQVLIINSGEREITHSPKTWFFQKSLSAPAERRRLDETMIFFIKVHSEEYGDEVEQ